MRDRRRRLTREETKGTRTYYLPFKRYNPETQRSRQPEVTLVVRRLGNGEYQAGVAICSREECFDKREGRARAFDRMRYSCWRCDLGIQTFATAEIHDEVRLRCELTNLRHPNTISKDTREDLLEVCQSLPKVFDGMRAKEQEGE